MTITNPPGPQTGSPGSALQFAISLLDEAHSTLKSVSDDLGGHRAKALEQIASAKGRLQQALMQVKSKG